MMKNLIRKAVPFLLLAPALILAGCYTQFGGVKGEDTPDEQSYNNDEYVDSAGGQYAYDDYARYPYGMSYYYPPYNDPWFYGARPIYGNGYGYTPYDAMWWDYSPYYYGGYYGSYYPPYYGYAYGGAYYGHGHGTELGSIGTRRTIGNIRATGATRGMQSGYMPTSRGSGSSLALPVGAARGTVTPAAAPKTSTTRSSTPSGSAVGRSGSGRSSSTGSGTRSSAPQSRPSSGGTRGGSSRGGSGHSSYTPPPPPPSSSGGTSSGGSSDRGSSGSSSGGSSSGGSRSGGSRR